MNLSSLSLPPFLFLPPSLSPSPSPSPSGGGGGGRGSSRSKKKDVVGGVDPDATNDIKDAVTVSSLCLYFTYLI